MKAELELAEKKPVAMTHKLLVQIKSAITEDLKKFKDLMENIGEEHTQENDPMIKVNHRHLFRLTLQDSKILEADLDALFKNIERTLKQFGSLSAQTQREATLQSNVKLAFGQFLQEKLPEFKVLQKV